MGQSQQNKDDKGKKSVKLKIDQQKLSNLKNRERKNGKKIV